MKKSLVISEQDNIGAILENERVVEFFVNRGELLLGDIYTASVENILPGIDAAFVNLGKDKMGFLHANDVPGQGPLKERLMPRQKLLVQITKEPTGHKGPRVSTAISLPGRFLVLVPEERGVSISRRVIEARERARLKAVVNLMKPPGVGLIIRTEAKGQGDQELFEDFEQLWDRWQTVVSEGESSIGPMLIYRDQDLLYRVIRDAYSHDVAEIIVDTADGQKRAAEYLAGWAGRQTKISCHSAPESLLIAKGIDKEIEAALSDRVELPSGGHLNIEPTEALTVIDVNSGRFTSSRTQAETVRRTNLEASQEISRQLRLRNIGGMVIVDFIDMDSRKDQQQVMEVFQRALEEDRAKPQVGQLSDLGLVELTRRRQGQSLRELFTVSCQSCAGLGVVPTLEIGAADQKRVITFQSKDEDLAGKGRNFQRKGNRQQGSVLRAATAAGGRIMPTVEEVPEFDDNLTPIPEHILEQMPDDLLNGTAAHTGKRGAFLDSESNGEPDEEHLEEIENNVRFSPENQNDIGRHNDNQSSGFFTQPKTQISQGLAENITAVHEVYKEIDSQETDRSSKQGFDDVVRAEPFIWSKQLGESTTLVADTENSFETEIDPSTGIYRLRTKPDAMPSQETGRANQPENVSVSEDLAHKDDEPVHEKVQQEDTDLSLVIDDLSQSEFDRDDEQNPADHEHTLISEAENQQYQQLKLPKAGHQDENQEQS